MSQTFTPGEYVRTPYDGSPYVTNGSSVRAVFFKGTLRDPERSRKAKKEIFYEQEIEYVRFIVPGDIKNVPIRKVTQDIIDEYPKEYEAFKRGEEVQISGHPLSKWDALTLGQVRSLASFNIETIEQLAVVSDSVLQAIGMGGRDMQNKARAFLSQAQGEKEAARDATITDLQRQIEELKAQLVAPSEDVVKRGPGRPRIIKEGEANG